MPTLLDSGSRLSFVAMLPGYALLSTTSEALGQLFALSSDGSHLVNLILGENRKESAN